MISRRTLFGGAATVAFAGAAGCTQLADWIAGFALSDVNLFNETDIEISGTIDVVDPSSETVLDESFELEAPAEEDEQDSEAGVTSFADVWGSAGTYEATVSLDSADVRGESTASASVSIEDPEQEMLAVVFGADEFDAGIAFTTGEEWSEFDRQ